MDMKTAALVAKRASIILSAAGNDLKNAALSKIAEALEKSREAIIAANLDDIERSKQEDLPAPLIKRLNFDEKKISEVLDGIKSLIELPEPAGRTLMSTELDEGLELYRVSCPIGVIGVIFESRPDALVQISTLCLKSGNSVILKGGSEARRTNRILADIIYNASLDAGLPEGWLYLAESRYEVKEMLKLDDYIDLIIPRGSNSFVKYIMDNSHIPVMGHSDGICHCYVDSGADMDMAVSVVVDSKTQYVAVCNAAETLLVNKDTAASFLPLIKKNLEDKGVLLKGCEKTRKIIDIPRADEEDWKTEYLDYILSIRIVENMEEAIDHINTYGSGHTDTIITSDRKRALQFMDLVDSGNVFWNASTRFSDGYRYGFGAEVGISTAKIHARGPVGLEGLMIYKYKLIGNGHIVQDYSDKKKYFVHKRLDKNLT